MSKTEIRILSLGYRRPTQLSRSVRESTPALILSEQVLDQAIAAVTARLCCALKNPAAAPPERVKLALPQTIFDLLRRSDEDAAIIASIDFLKSAPFTAEMEAK